MTEIPSIPPLWKYPTNPISPQAAFHLPPPLFFNLSALKGGRPHKPVSKFGRSAFKDKYPPEQKQANLYRFDLKIHGSDRRDSRAQRNDKNSSRCFSSKALDSRAQRSFGLPGANQNRAGILSRQKPENSNKISINRYKNPRPIQ